MENFNSTDLQVLINLRNQNDNLNQSGIYGFFLCDKCIYVGQANNLLYRLFSHLECIAASEVIPDEPYNKKYKYMAKYFNNLSWKVLEHTENLNIRENYWINYYNPIFNILNPNGTYDFIGTDEDIDDFVFGLINMEDLQELKISRKAIRKEKEFEKVKNLDPKWLNKKLSANNKRDLCDELKLKDNRGRQLNWTSVKKILIQAGYTIVDKKIHGYRYSIISIN